MTAERVKAADSLRAAIGSRLAEAASRWRRRRWRRSPSMPHRHSEQTAAAAVSARQALDEVREVAARFRDAPWPEAVPAEPGEPPAPRLARAVLVVTLCGLAVLYPLFVAVNVNGVPGGYSALVVALAIADAAAFVIVQLRHSWPSRGTARPRGWPATLLLQAVLMYALVPAGRLASPDHVRVPRRVGAAARPGAGRPGRVRRRDRQRSPGVGGPSPGGRRQPCRRRWARCCSSPWRARRSACWSSG